MRRMVDPKELNQGGGDKKKYRHILSCDFDIKGMSAATFNLIKIIIDNESAEEFTKASLVEYIKKIKFLPAYGTGDQYVGDRYVIVYSIESDTSADCSIDFYEFAIETKSDGTSENYIKPSKNSRSATIRNYFSQEVIEL